MKKKEDINKNKLLNKFINLKKTTNIYTMKCLKLLFPKLESL